MIAAWLHRRHLKHRDMVWLEVTPLASRESTLEAAEQLFSVIHGMKSMNGWKPSLLRRAPVLSCEITSTKQKGIRYILQVERQYAAGLEKTIAAYMPYAKVMTIESPETVSDQVLDVTTKSHFAFPLVLPSRLEQVDPLTYVTSAMTKLDNDERVTLQLVLSPVVLRQARVLASKLLRNEDVLSTVSPGRFAWLQIVANGISVILWGLADLFSEAYYGSRSNGTTMRTSSSEVLRQKQIHKRERPARTLSTFEQELMQSMQHKLSQPLFSVNLRILATGPRANEHLRAIRTALSGYSVPLYQTLQAKVRMPMVHNHRIRLANERLPNLFRRSRMILSASELASLYHLPSSVNGRTDNVMTSLTKTLPAPVSLKSGRELAVLIGANHHHGVVTPIGLTEAERERHVFIIGGTGNGKTTMLLYAILQDIKSGKGLAVIDPHGDLAETILRHLPPERLDDVIYMNPDDLSYPIGMNLLELPSGLSGDDLLREKDVITESVISVMRKIFSDDDHGGHRVEYILRNAVQTALTLRRPTLFTVFRLLTDNRYRRDVVRNLKDENLKNFWRSEIGKAGDMQRVKMSAGITAKIGRFLFSASAKRVLEQEKSTIDFEAVINDGKILICNFSKGLLGEDTSALFGTTVLAKLQLASLRRARIATTERRPFYLYVDEFQNFATMSFTQMLSEARKYKLLLTMAEQSTSQQDEQRLVDIILANVGTVVCFRSGSPADERMVLPLFYPYIEQGEIANLPAYSFYARISAMDSQEPLSGVTVVHTAESSEKVSQLAVDSSRKKYAKKLDIEVGKKLARVRRVSSNAPRSSTVQSKTASSKRDLRSADSIS